MQIPWYVGWLVAACACLGLLYLAASRAAYHPLPYPAGFWKVQSQLGAVDVWLRTSDRLRLHSWWTPAQGSSLVTLYLHGNAGNVTHRFAQIQEITSAGSSVLMLDYRGYGKSEGHPTESGLYLDADAAYEYLRNRGYGPAQIIVHGESLGAAVAVDLASRKECAAIVLEAAFTSGSDVAGTVLPLIGPLLFRGFDSKGKIAQIRAPILFLHGERDDIIPARLGRALFDAAPQPKTFIEIPGAGHNDLVEIAGRDYSAKLREFYAAL